MQLPISIITIQKQFYTITKSQLFQNAIAQASQTIVGLVLTRELIKTLGSTQYGYISLAILILSFSSTLDGLRNLLTQHIHNNTKDSATSIFMRSMERYNFALAALSAIATFAVVNTINTPFSIAGSVLLAFAVGLNVAQSPYCAKLLSENKPGQVALTRSVYWSVVYLTLLGLASKSSPPFLNIVALFTATAGLTVAYRAMAFREVSLFGATDTGNRSLFLKLVISGLAFNALSAALSFSDRFLLLQFRDRATFGTYAAIYDLGSKLWWPGLLFSSSAFPAWSLLHSRSRFDTFQSRTRTDLFKIALAYLPISLVVTMFTPTIIRLWAPRLPQCGETILAFRIIVCAATLQGIGSVAGFALVASGRIKDMIQAYLTSNILIAATGPFLVARFGLVGAAAIFLLARSADVLMILRLLHQPCGKRCAKTQKAP